MKARSAGPSARLAPDRQRTRDADRELAGEYRRRLAAYRDAVTEGKASPALTARARRALLHLGGDPERSSVSLKDYDAQRYGPFLGVSDEGSAARAIRAAAWESPKVTALPKSTPPTPIVVGVAVDAERLGGVGEIAVGPDEYADVWLECVDRMLITTNVGTRVNMRVYRREPWIVLSRDTAPAIEAARREIAAAFRPFVDTPDGNPRPLTVFVEIPRRVRMSMPRRRAVLRRLVEYVTSGQAAGSPRRAPPGHALGLAARVPGGLPGRDAALAAIDLAASAGMEVVALEGTKRRVADRAVSLAGLLDYLEPGLVGPILRHAAKREIRIRAANLPDTDTIARSTWVALTTARAFGAHLGKYGCFPLTRAETDHVVALIQGWLSDWSAAPVFFVDQGLLGEASVDVGRDLARGLHAWLETVAAHGVRIVLIDTIDKATGRRLLKKSSRDETGFLGPVQIRRAEAFARKLGVKVLWAGGMDLRDAYRMGKLGVFGIYVTSAAATTIPVGGSYIRDPSLAGLKEPSREGVLRTKILLEAGFLSGRLPAESARRIERIAEQLLAFHDRKDARGVAEHAAKLAAACVDGWRSHWKLSTPKGKRDRGSER